MTKAPVPGDKYGIAFRAVKPAHCASTNTWCLYGVHDPKAGTDLKGMYLEYVWLDDAGWFMCSNSPTITQGELAMFDSQEEALGYLAWMKLKQVD